MIKWAQRAIERGQRCSCCNYAIAKHVMTYEYHGKTHGLISCDECREYLENRHNAKVVENYGVLPDQGKEG